MEVGADPDQCGKLNFWLFGFRKAASGGRIFLRRDDEVGGFSEKASVAR